MNIKSYIDNRFSSLCIKAINSAEDIEIFRGTFKELQNYHSNICFIKNEKKNSTGIATTYDKKTVVFFNVFSEAKTTDCIYRIAYIVNHYKLNEISLYTKSSSEIGHKCQKKFSTIKIIKNIDRYLGDLSSSFVSHLANNELRSKNIIIIIGARNKPTSCLIENHSFESESYAIYQEFRYSILKRIDQDVVAICMPNGDLAYHVMKALIDKVNTVVSVIMVGAGGAFPKNNAKVGDYNFCKKSYMNSYLIDLSANEKITFIQPEKKGEFSIFEGDNITVQSPLEEDDIWYNKHYEDKVSVDVETYHIFKALDETKKRIALVSGVFFSDVLKEHPLEEKINVKNAWKYMELFFNSVIPKIQSFITSDIKKP